MNLISSLINTLSGKNKQGSAVVNMDDDWYTQEYIKSTTDKPGQPYNGEMPTLSEQDPDWYKKQ